MKKTLLITMLAVLAPMLANAAVGKPTLVVDGMQMSRAEVSQLCETRIAYQRAILARLGDLSRLRTDASDVEASELDAAAVMPDGADKDTRIADAGHIAKGARKRIKVSVRDLSIALTARPTVEDVRRKTIGKVYNSGADILRGNEDADTTLSRTEAHKLPAFLFTEIDTNSDDQLSTTELGAYLLSL